jgi:hypothetical protein
VALNAPVVSPSEASIPPSWLLSALVVVAIVVASTRPSWRWAAIAACGAALLYCLAAGSNSDFAKVATGLWYKDKYRLIALLPVITAPLAAGTIALLFRWLAGQWGRRAATAGVAILACTVLSSSWFGPGLAATREAIATVNNVPPGAKDGALLNSDELKLLRRLPELTPGDAVIVGNPWNGSVLTWAVGGREALFPHLTGDWDADRRIVAERLDALGGDPEVCAALDRLGARYLFTSSGLLWNGDPQANAYQGIDRTRPEAIGKEVARNGDSALYLITTCG